jgi:5-methyltetrahydrofolate--homocysteine methyltransferase
MVHFAKEMEREGLNTPLIIGGATTSRIHTVVKINPNYAGPVVHVLDASRSVTVVSNLLNKETRKNYIAEIAADYEKTNIEYLAKATTKTVKPIADARARKLPIDWANETPVKPTALGVQVFDNFDLEELAQYIDWTPFFHTWELRGSYPKIFNDEYVGIEAKKLFDDARLLLKKIIDEKLLTAKGVVGFFPANSVGDDIEIYTDENRSSTIATIHTLRQQAEKADLTPYYALSDFVAPKESAKQDYFGAFAVTTGIGIEKMVEEFEKNHDDYNSIMVKALADRLAEAFAERLHQIVRKEIWAYSKNETLSNEELIKEKYTGIRPAPGYPACPDHTEKRTLFDLLNVEANTGINLTENFAMYPTAAVSGFYFAHPQARYFGLGKIGKDQVIDYAERKGLTVAETERWLAPNLAY